MRLQQDQEFESGQEEPHEAGAPKYSLPTFKNSQDPLGRQSKPPLSSTSGPPTSALEQHTLPQLGISDVQAVDTTCTVGEAVRLPRLMATMHVAGEAVRLPCLTSGLSTSAAEREMLPRNHKFF